MSQAEVSKFQDTVLLVQDYYASLQGSPPAQLPAMAKVALIEVLTHHQNLSHSHDMCCFSLSALHLPSLPLSS